MCVEKMKRHIRYVKAWLQQAVALRAEVQIFKVLLHMFTIFLVWYAYLQLVISTPPTSNYYGGLMSLACRKIAMLLQK